MINLISDTITVPSKEMLEYMMQAEVGDDVFKSDPTVVALEQKLATMFEKEAALFCPSGTMSNQIAIKLSTKPLDEMICDKDSHVYYYETGGYAFHSGIAVKLIDGKSGKITGTQIKESINGNYDWLPKSSLVVLENTCNRGGGSYYQLDEIIEIRKVCLENKLKLHLDGARLFNALVETRESTQEWGAMFDSISICLSKGLGAPVGSVLLGSAAFIAEARRVRKVMGGGMRQAGYLAAAGIFALDNHIEDLKKDHLHAKQIGEELKKMKSIVKVHPIFTNIIIFEVQNNIGADKFLSVLKDRGILASAFGKNTIRFVTHRDVNSLMVEKTIDVLKSLSF